MAMTAIKRLSVATAVSFSLSLLAAGEAFAAYTFTKIADTSDSFSGLNSPMFNDRNTVLFEAQTKAGPFGYFTISADGTTTTIADSSTIQGFGSYTINNKDLVLFQAVPKGGVFSLFTSSGGATTTIADINEPYSSFAPADAINKRGTVAFNAFLKSGVQGIFTSIDGATTTIADTSEPYSSFSFNSLDINKRGTVVFSASLKSGGSGIFTSIGGVTTTIASSQPAESFNDFALNDRGTVVFDASFFNPALTTQRLRDELLIESGGMTTTIADTSGAFDSFYPGLNVNNRGTVAFEATLKGGGFGIFTAPDPVTDKVIATGDSLFGSTVTALSFAHKGLNNRNQLVFYAALADGNQVIVRADPESVRQPNSDAEN